MYNHMKLTREEILKIAQLARIELREEEIEKYREQLSDILGYVGKLQEINTESINPDLYAADLVNTWREDNVAPCPDDENQGIFENMPAKEGNELKTMGIFKKQ